MGSIILARGCKSSLDIYCGGKALKVPESYDDEYRILLFNDFVRKLCDKDLILFIIICGDESFHCINI